MTSSDDFSSTLELLAQARAGHSASLHRLLARYRPVLLRRIRLMMGEQARRQAESGDLLQEVMLAVVQDVGSFEPRDESSFLRWITTIVRHRIADSVRRRREKTLDCFLSDSGLFVNKDQTTPSAEVAHEEQIALLAEALDSIDDNHRTVIELRHFESLPFRVVAELMGRSENAVQLLHARALVALGRWAAKRGIGS